MRIFCITYLYDGFTVESNNELALLINVVRIDVAEFILEFHMRLCKLHDGINLIRSSLPEGLLCYSYQLDFDKNFYILQDDWS